MLFNGFGSEMSLPTVPGFPSPPELPGIPTEKYIPAATCEAKIAALQQRWDDHVPVMIIGAVAAVGIGFMIGKAM